MINRHMHVFVRIYIYIYLINIHSIHMLCKQKLVFWMRLIAINHLTAFIFVLKENNSTYLIKNRNIVCKYYDSFKYFVNNLFLWWQSWIFSINTPIFSVTWCFINHSNIMICWNISYYYHQCWKQFCWLIFLWWYDNFGWIDYIFGWIDFVILISPNFWTIWG